MSRVRIAIEAPMGDQGSLSYVGASLVRALDELGQAPAAIPLCGIFPSQCPPAVARGIERHRIRRSVGGIPVYDRILRFAFPQHLPQARSLEHAFLVFWDSDQLSETMARTLTRYHKIYGISRFVARVVAHYTNRQVGVIGHGVWPEACPYIPHSANGPFTFLHLGQVDRRKATDVVMRAFVKAFSHGERDVRLVVKCGPQHDEAAHESLAHQWLKEFGKSDERITIDARHVTRAALSNYFAEAHVVLMPSRCEGFGLVGLEALAHGRQLFATNWSGTMDYFDFSDCVGIPTSGWTPADGYPGRSREPDEEALVEAMRHAHANFEQVCSAGLRGRARILRDWTWTKQVAEGYL